MNSSAGKGIRKLLVVRNDRIGDLVLTFPLFKSIKTQLPDAEVSAFLSPYTEPLAKLCPFIDRIVLDRPDLGGWALGKTLREHEFDAALLINTNTRNTTAVWRAGIQVRVAWSHKPVGWLLGNRKVKLHRTHPPIHETDFALAFLAPLELLTERPSIEGLLEIPSVTTERIAKRITDDLGGNGKLYGIAPACGGSAFNWPPARYGELAARLCDSGRVFLAGAPKDKPVLDAVIESMPEGKRASVGSYTDLALDELAALLSLADAFVASSTGPLHVAAAVGTKVVGLYSPNPAHSPVKWGPLGEGHTILVPELQKSEGWVVPDDRGEEVMLRLQVDEVVAACG